MQLEGKNKKQKNKNKIVSCVGLSLENFDDRLLVLFKLKFY